MSDLEHTAAFIDCYCNLPTYNYEACAHIRVLYQRFGLVKGKFRKNNVFVYSKAKFSANS